MSSLYRRGDSRYWWYKERLPGRRKPLYMSLRIQDKRLAKLRQQQLDRILTELRLPQHDWTFAQDLERDAQLRAIVFEVCADLGITLTLQTNVTIARALKEYEAYSLTKKTTRTHRTDWTRLTGFIRWAGGTYLHEIRSGQIQDYLVHRIQQAGVSKKTANHTLQAIKGFLNFCIRRDLLRANPANKVERFNVPVVPQHFLRDGGDILHLLKTARRADPAMYPMVAAGVYTGCRLGELMGLEWEDIDFLFRKIMVKDKPELGLRTKTGKFRVIPLHPDLTIILRPFRRDSGFVFFPERTESRKYTTPLYQRWKAIRKAAGMPETTWYSLRRTFCSHLAMSGVSLLKIQVWAGHSDPRMTKEHYAHLTPEYDSEIERIMEKGRDGYDLVTFEGEPQKAISHYLMQDSGLSPLQEWREPGVVLRTKDGSPRELPDDVVRAFKDWCASPEMQVMSASFGHLLTAN